MPQPVATSFRIVEMENNEIQRISNKFTQNLLIIQIIVFLSLVALMVSTTYLLKRELANQAVRTVGGKVKRGDTREIINILSDSENNDFIAVDFYDKNSNLQFTFPTSFRRNISLYQKLWRKLTHATYQKKIFFDLKSNDIAATILFTFEVFQFLPMAVSIFLLGLLASYPLTRKYKKLLLENSEKEAIRNQTEAISELARQVRHDYKSPLMAIKSVIDQESNLKDAEKRTLTIAYNKMISMLGDLSPESIKDILRDKSKNKALKALTHIYSSILNVVQEKQARMGENFNIDMKISCSNEDKKAYLLVDDIELQRILSNIIENSIDSIRETGKILIEMKVENSNLEITITDNGKGIPENLLDKVGQKGFSFGKKNGEGLGLYSAIKKIKAWNGSLNIHSNNNAGTQVKISLPGAVSPEWAHSTIPLKGIKNIVILDDDKSVHQIWDKILKEKTPANIYKFTSAQKLTKKLDDLDEKTLFLLDYELRGQKETGLNVAEILDQKSLCYLVSNSFQDPKLQRECKRLGVYLFPKTLMEDLPETVLAQTYPISQTRNRSPIGEIS